MNEKKQKKLSIRMTIYCIVFACVLSTLIGGLGFYTYYTNSIKHYEKYIKTVLRIAGDAVDGDDIGKSVEASKLSSMHGETQQRINSIKKNTEIEYIYIIAPDKKGRYVYVMCGYNEEELKNPEEQKGFGDVVEETDIASDMIQNFAEVMEGKTEEGAIPNTSDLGYVMTGIVPVKDTSGKIVATMGVDIAMEDIISDLRNYVISVLTGICILAAAFSIVYLKVVRKMIVKPVLALGKHADEFVNQTKGKPSEITVKELEIATGDEIELLSRQLNNMMKDMVAYMSDLESVTAVQERFAVQLNLAKQIQQSMLPRVFPAFPERTEFDIYAVMQPAKTVGGDFYDFFFIDGTHLGVVVADVSGEGVPAALFMMMTRTLIKNYSVLGLEPAKVFIEVNNELCENNDTEMTVKAFMGILDVYNGDFTYVSAGEHTPLLKRKDGIFEYLTVKSGFLLGSLEKVPFYQEYTKMGKGEILCLFTSGVANMKNKEGERFSLKESLNRVLTEQAGIDGLLNQALEEAGGFIKEGEREEDLTMLAVKFEGVNLK